MHSRIYNGDKRNVQEELAPVIRANYIRSLEDNSIIVDFADETPLFTIKILLTILSIGVFALALAVMYLLYLRFQDLKNAEENQESNEGPLGISALITNDMDEWLENELGSSVSSKSSSLSSLTKSMKLCKTLEGDNTRTPDTSRLSEYGIDEYQITLDSQRTQSQLKDDCVGNATQRNDPDPYDVLNRVDSESHNSSYRLSNAGAIIDSKNHELLTIPNQHEEETSPPIFSHVQQKTSYDSERAKSDSGSKDETAHEDGNKIYETEEEGYNRLQEI